MPGAVGDAEDLAKLKRTMDRSVVHAFHELSVYMDGGSRQCSDKFPCRRESLVRVLCQSPLYGKCHTPRLIWKQFSHIGRRLRQVRDQQGAWILVVEGKFTC